MLFVSGWDRKAKRPQISKKAKFAKWGPLRGVSRPGPRSPTTRARAPAARQLSGSPPASRPPTWRRPPPATATTTTRTRTTRRRPPAASPPASRLRAPRRPTEQRAHDLPPRPGRRHARLLRSADPPPPPPPSPSARAPAPLAGDFRALGGPGLLLRARGRGRARTHARTHAPRARAPPSGPRPQPRPGFSLEAGLS